MTETPSDDTEDRSSEDRADGSTLAVTSAYKVLGELTDQDGVGVLGQNNATSGVPVGVQGAVPNADNGYGLYTSNDLLVLGTAELSTLGGGITNGESLIQLPGNNLAINQEGVLNYVGPTYQNETLQSSGETWDPVGVLNSETRVEVTVDAGNLTSGRVRVDVDGSRAALLNGGDAIHRIFTPGSTLTVNNLDGWGQDGSVDVTSQTSQPWGVAFKGDGTVMFVAGFQARRVYSYTLSTAWDVTTASFDTSYDVSSNAGAPEDLAFKSDGTKMYVVDSNSVYAYDLSSAWDVSSASFDASYSLADGAALTFKNDGTKMYTAQSQPSWVLSYSLATPWDISTASFQTRANILDGPGRPRAVTFDGDGSTLFVTFLDRNDVHIYALSTAWDISTASLLLEFDLNLGNDELVEGVALKPDGTRMYVSTDGVGTGGSVKGTVYSYNKTFSGEVYASTRRT